MIICVWNLLFVYNILVPGVGALKFLNDPPFAMIGYMGLNVDINCSTNDPNATVTLLHQASFTTWVEKTVTPNKLILTGQVFKLLDLVVSDGGRYNCKATDGNDTIRWPTFKGMLVLKPGSLPSYFELVPKKPIIVLQGKGGQITCEAEGKEVSTLTWKKRTSAGGDVSVPDSMVTNAKDEANNLVKAILTITNARPEDAGDYKCVLAAFNKQDYKLTSIRVDAPMPPTINDYTGETTITEGMEKVLKCEAKGAPKPNAAWYRNGKELNTTDCHVTPNDKSCDDVIYEVYEDNPSSSMHSTYNTQVLKIRSALYPRDQGKFECIATNGQLPNDNLVIDLNVQVLAFLKKPHIVLEGYLSRNSRIDCSTNDGNATVSLLHKYHPLAAFTERQLKSNKLSRKGQVFKLLNLDVGDAGIYACEARSQASKVIRWPHGTGYLFLSRARLPDLFVLKPEQPILVLKGEDANVTCESEGIAVTKLRWKKQTSSSYVSVPDNMVTIVKDSSTNRVRAILKITNAQMQDGGVYKCVLRVFGKKDYKLTRIVIGEI